MRSCQPGSNCNPCFISPTWEHNSRASDGDMSMVTSTAEFPPGYRALLARQAGGIEQGTQLVGALPEADKARPTGQGLAGQRNRGLAARAHRPEKHNSAQSVGQAMQNNSPDFRIEKPQPAGTSGGDCL